jgi:hypothetical protein
VIIDNVRVNRLANILVIIDILRLAFVLVCLDSESNDDLVGMGGDLPVQVGAVVHLDRRLLFGGFNEWSSLPVMRPRDEGLVVQGLGR